MRVWFRRSQCVLFWYGSPVTYMISPVWRPMFHLARTTGSLSASKASCRRWANAVANITPVRGVRWWYYGRGLFTPSQEASVWVWVLATWMRTPPSGGRASASVTRGIEGRCSPLASPQTQPISHMCVYMVHCTTLVFDCLLIILPLAHFHCCCPHTLSFSVISLALLWYLWWSLTTLSLLC